MNIASRAAMLVCLLAAGGARAADNIAVERLATCQDSWFEWRNSDPGRLRQFLAAFQSDFSRKEGDAFYLPRSSQTVAGLPLLQVFLQNVGMGVGFSVVVGSTFDRTKAAVEKRIGRPIAKCEPPSDNMRTCELELGDKKTVTLLSEDKPNATKTLIGCYYFYEK